MTVQSAKTNGFSMQYSMASLSSYVSATQKQIYEPLNHVLKQRNSVFVNTRELDDLLCDHLKDSEVHYDGTRKWIEINRNLRIRIITRVLLDDMGYTMWSGTTRKVLRRPDNQET